MNFDPPLQRGTLLKRYKRFLADIETEQGEVLTVHCPNTGSMRGCCTPGSPAWFSDSGNPKRKYRHTWELVQINGAMIGINTGRANTLVEEAISAGRIPALMGASKVAREVRYGSENSRIDLLLSGPEISDTYIEVKSVTLAEGEQGLFPDAVTTRGQKHLRELMAQRAEGLRAVLMFCVQHTGVTSVQAAAAIDPAYAQLLGEASRCGVEIMAWQCDISATATQLVRPLPVMI